MSQPAISSTLNRPNRMKRTPSFYISHRAAGAWSKSAIEDPIARAMRLHREGLGDTRGVPMIATQKPRFSLVSEREPTSPKPGRPKSAAGAAATRRLSGAQAGTGLEAMGRARSADYIAWLTERAKTGIEGTDPVGRHAPAHLFGPGLVRAPGPPTVRWGH